MNIDLQPLLALLTAISVIWAIRAHFKAYQREDSSRVAESVLATERIAALNIRVDTLSSRVSELEKSSHEMYVFRNQMVSVTDDLKQIKQNIAEIMTVLISHNRN